MSLIRTVSLLSLTLQALAGPVPGAQRRAVNYNVGDACTPSDPQDACANDNRTFIKCNFGKYVFMADATSTTRCGDGGIPYPLVKTKRSYLSGNSTYTSLGSSCDGPGSTGCSDDTHLTICAGDHWVPTGAQGGYVGEAYVCVDGLPRLKDITR